MVLAIGEGNWVSGRRGEEDGAACSGWPGAFLPT